MSGTDNLRPVRTKEEARERGRNGGIASGKARRKKSSLKRAAQAVLTTSMPKQVKAQIEKMVGKIDDENDMLYTAAVAVMTKEALSGNVAAFNSLKDIVESIENQIEQDNLEPDPLSASLEELAKTL